MNSNQKLHQARLYEWSIKISNQKASGLTVPQWCKQNGLSVHAYNYWKHLLKQEVVDQVIPDIVPLPITSVSSSDSYSSPPRLLLNLLLYPIAQFGRIVRFARIKAPRS